MWRFFGHAKADPSHSEAAGICDRCNFTYQLRDLHWQYQWRGSGLVNTMFRVCPKCLDVPSEFLKALKLPADPIPVPFPRPNQFQQQINNGIPITVWDQLYGAWDSQGNVWLP